MTSLPRLVFTSCAVLSVIFSTGAVLRAEDAQQPRSYFITVSEHLLRVKRFPPDPELKGKAGLVHLSFALDRSGQVIRSRIVKSSCITQFDEEALAMLLRAGAFPPFPDTIAQAEMSFTQPIIFGARESTARLDPSQTCEVAPKPSQ